MLGAIKKKVRQYLYKKGYDVVYVNHRQLEIDARRNKDIPKGTHIDTFGLRHIHYGSGWYKLKKDWLNVDYELEEKVATNYDLNEYKYLFVNLLCRHPFPDNYFEYGYSEDVIEHFMQTDSIIFLTEAFRTLKKGGVLRLSFPCLEGVLNRHYPNGTYETAIQAKDEAYVRYGHLHFYSKEELKLVAEHIGFTDVKFVEYGVSEHAPLNNLDTRESQIGLNMYVELTK